MENGLKSELYNAIRKYLDALEAADVVSEARYQETPTERAERERKEVEAIQRRIFGDD